MTDLESMGVVIDIVRQPAVLDSPAGEGRVTEAVSRREDPKLVDERSATFVRSGSL